MLQKLNLINHKNQMKTLYQSLMKKLIIILYLAGLTACAPTNNIAWHQKLQEEATFANRLDQNKAFTIGGAKDANASLKDQIRDQEKRNKENEKRKEIEEENAELRAKLEAAKKNNP